jgi:hypothetical protein
MTHRHLLPILLLPLTTLAQKVEQTVPFRYTDYQNTPTRASLAAIGLDPATKTLTVYGWHPMKGRVDSESAPAPKKGGGLMGKLAKAAASVSSLEGGMAGAKEEETAVPMVFTRTFALPSLALTDQQKDFIAPGELDLMKKYNFMTTLRAGDDTPGKTPVTLDFAHAAQKYPLLTAAGHEPKFTLQTEGGQLAVVTSPTPAFGVLATTGAIGRRPAQALQRDANQQQLQGLKQVYTLSSYPIPGSELRFALATAEDKDDKWAMYKLYRIVVFNKEAQVVRVLDPKFEYIRDLTAVSDVVDENGTPKGVLLTFGNLVSFAGKKHRDPIENRHNVVLIDTEGNLTFSYGFEQGDPDNGRGFNPIAVVEQKGQLTILSTNAEKLLKPYLETVTLGKEGKLSAIRSEQPLRVNGVDVNTLTDGTTKSGHTYRFNGMTYVVKQQLTTKLSRAGTLSETVYDAVQIVALKNDLTVSSAISVPAGSKTEPMQVRLVGETNSTPRLILTSPGGNQIVTLGEQLRVVNVTPEGGRVPISPIMDLNFAYDSATQKGYFMYEMPKPGEAKLVTVAFD